MQQTKKWAENLWKWADENDISSDHLPRDFDKLIKERRLTLRGCNITSLPNEFGELTKLYRLYLDDNQILISDELAKKIIHTSIYIYKFASKAIQNDKEIALRAIRSDGLVLQYLIEEFKNDKEIVLKAIEDDASALEYASEKLKHDKNFLFEAVELNGNVLKYIIEELQNDKTFVLKAVELNGYALEYASEEYKNDEEVVLTAVKPTNKHTYEYMRNEDTRNEDTFKYASIELRNNKAFVLKVIDKNGLALKYASEELQKDEEVIEKAIQSNEIASDEAAEKFKIRLEKRQRIIYDGIFEDTLRSIRDILRWIVSKEEASYIRYELRKLTIEMAGMEETDYAEELYYLIKEKKREIEDTDNIKEKLIILKYLIDYIRENYDLDDTPLMHQHLITKDNFTLNIHKKELFEDDKNKIFEVLKHIEVYAPRDNKDLTDKYIKKNKKILKELISMDVGMLDYFSKEFKVGNRLCLFIQGGEVIKNIIIYE